MSRKAGQDAGGAALVVPSASGSSFSTGQRLKRFVAVDEVLRPLKSGKEASVYVVRCGDDIRCAQGLQGHGAAQLPGSACSTRKAARCAAAAQARAIGKASKFGRKEQEAAWKNTEVDALYQLRRRRRARARSRMAISTACW